MNNSSPLRIVRGLAVAALPVWVSVGCATARPYSTPVAVTPAAWSAAPASSPASADMELLGHWWSTFDDPQLTSLVEQAVTGSPDVRTAVSRVHEARASLASTRSTRLPSADGSGSARLSGNSGDHFSQSYSLSLDASWEPDVFGGTRSAIDASAATAEARSLDLRDVLVSLSAEVAIDYIEVRSAQNRLALARSNLNLQDETLELTRLRAQAGLSTDIDVQQALANTETTRSQIAQLVSQVQLNHHALAVLLGRPPAALDGALGAEGAIPSAPVTVAVGVPAETLRRRPDVRSAERQLAAQFAQVNVARADLYPSFRLTGSIGLEALSLAKVLLPGAGFWNGGLSVNSRLFNREQLRQNVVIQTERQEQAMQTYETRVLSALRDVEDALTSLAQEQVRRDHLVAAAAAAGQAADLSLQLYRSGLRDFRDVLDNQRSLVTLQDSLASSTASVSENLVRLYKALGGGWQAATGLPADVGGAPSGPDRALIK